MVSGQGEDGLVGCVDLGGFSKCSDSMALRSPSHLLQSPDLPSMSAVPVLHHADSPSPSSSAQPAVYIHSLAYASPPLELII